MVGLIQWTKHRQKPNVNQIMDLRLCTVSVLRKPHTPSSVLRRRMKRAARYLHAAGVTRTILPADWRTVSGWEAAGLHPVECLPLWRRLAAEWTFARLQKEKWNSETAVAVVTDRLDETAVQTVTALCRRLRYVMLVLPQGGETLCRTLRREYGVSVLLNPSRSQLERAGVLIRFCNKPAVPCRGEMLCLYPGGELTQNPVLKLPPEVEKQLPVEADQIQLVTVLTTCGMLPTEQIELKLQPLPLDNRK